jgi:DNA-binding MarR family transcriptional regulator
MLPLEVMNQIAEYLGDTFGEHIRPIPEKEKAKNLPLYLKGNYDFFSVDIFGNKIILVEVKKNTRITPDQLKKQGNLLSQLMNAPIVFVFDKLESWLRKRLIEKKVGFAEPFQQLYIPDLLIQIKDTKRKDLSYTTLTNKLKPPTQCLLLYHLQKEPLGQKLFQQIASILNYSPMTITRAVKELENFELAEIKAGKEKSLHFKSQGRPLWEKALPYLDTPIRETWLSDRFITNEHCRFSGDTALSMYTMIAETNQKIQAIGKEAFRFLKNHSEYKDLNKDYGDFKLEVWHYDPTLLSNNGKVDRLSLFLSMRIEQDERVQASLENLLNDIKW